MNEFSKTPKTRVCWSASALAVAAAVCVARDRAHSRPMRRRATAPPADCRGHGRRESRRCADLSSGTRHRPGLLHGDGDRARRWRAAENRRSPKARPCTRAICSRRSIRGRIRRPTIRRSPPRRRMRRMLANAKRDLDRYIAAATAGSGQQANRRYGARAGRSAHRAAAGRSGRRSTMRARSSTTRASPRRSTAAPEFG